MNRQTQKLKFLLTVIGVVFSLNTQLFAQNLCRYTFEDLHRGMPFTGIPLKHSWGSTSGFLLDSHPRLFKSPYFVRTKLNELPEDKQAQQYTLGKSMVNILKYKGEVQITVNSGQVKNGITRDQLEDVFFLALGDLSSESLFSYSFKAYRELFDIQEEGSSLVIVIRTELGHSVESGHSHVAGITRVKAEIGLNSQVDRFDRVFHRQDQIALEVREEDYYQPRGTDNVITFGSITHRTPPNPDLKPRLWVGISLIP